MPQRGPTKPVQLKIWLPSDLLTGLRADAERDGWQLSVAISRRLQQSRSDEDLGGVVFGSAERFGLLAALDRLILAAEMKTGKSIEDRETRHLMADQISSFFKDILEIYPSFVGRPLAIGEVRTLAESYALTALAALRGQPVVFPADPAAAATAADEAAAAAAEFVKRFPDHPFSRGAAQEAAVAEGEGAQRRG